MTSKLPIVVMIRNGQVLFVAINDENGKQTRGLCLARDALGVESIALRALIVVPVTGGARPASPQNARHRAGDTCPA
jgi:hypothetical protein